MPKSKIVSEPGIQIDEEFSSLIPPATADELARLTESLLHDGCLDPLVVWDQENILLDGHTRYRLCSERDLPFSVKRLKFDTRHAARNWVINHQLGRRNISDENRRYLLGKLYNEEKADPHSRPENKANMRSDRGAQNEHRDRTADRLAKENKTNASYVRRAGEYAEAIDAIGAEAPTLKDGILSGEVKATDKAVKQVADLPARSVRKVAKVAQESGELKIPEQPEPSADTAEARMAEWNRQVESFARAITAIKDVAPEGGWLDQTRLGILSDQLKSAANTARQTKGHGVCSYCDGHQCKKCRQTGFLPKVEFESAPVKQ